jgi:TatD DNase family protein
LKYFNEQVKLSGEVNKPLFLHEREAFEDMYSILSEQENLKAVVHCFTGNRQMAEKYLGLGCYIGITGWVCDDRRNQDVLDALEIIPVDKLMVETDAPYLLPRKIKGLKNPNVPENIRYVVEKIAMVKGLDPEDLRKRVLENTIRFFQISI